VNCFETDPGQGQTSVYVISQEMRCYALSGIGNSKVGDNTARVLVHSPAPLVAIRTYVGNGLRRWLYDACLRLFLVGLDVSSRNCNCSVP